MEDGGGGCIHFKLFCLNSTVYCDVIFFQVDDYDFLKNEKKILR
jgi:hypothetical protein